VNGVNSPVPGLLVTGEKAKRSAAMPTVLEGDAEKTLTSRSFYGEKAVGVNA